MVSILFVCLGNICRSPTAEGVFRHVLEQAGLADRVLLDSAGTGAWHVGKAPDERTCRAARARGYALENLRVRQVCVDDFHRFDLILAMDRDNLQNLNALQPAGAKAELSLYLQRCGSSTQEVPDPYYGGADGFEQVLDLLESAARVLLEEVRRRV